MIKYIVITLLTLCALTQKSHAQSVTFYDRDVYQALKIAQKTSRTIILELHAPWNYKSQWMHTQIQQAKCLEGQNGMSYCGGYITVSTNTETEQGRALAQLYGVTDYPAIVVFDNRGDALSMLTQPLTATDFCKYLTSIKLQEDTRANQLLNQIFRTAQQNPDPQVLDAMVGDYIQSQPAEYLVIAEHFDMFTNPLITKYGTPSYKFLVQNLQKFADTKLAKEQIERCVLEPLIPMATGITATNPEFIQTLAKDTTTHKIIPTIPKIINLTQARNQQNPQPYIDLTQEITPHLPQKYEYQTITAIEFTAEILPQNDREYRRKARKMLQNLQQKMESPAKMTIIKEILNKF